MKTRILPILVRLGSLSVAISCLASCVGHVDRVEDRYDRRVYTGPGDRAEDYWDKRENVNDKLRGRRGLRY
jgi:hypothetical protein